MGAVMHRGLTIRSGECHVHRYMRPLMERIEAGQIDPTVVITHRLPLSEAAEGYRLFRDRLDGCVKVVLRPDGPTSD
jgi:threonine dehydrogenase-like Zn-dependent dehydrogenase